ncbi:riboflavin synthase subunit alpha [Salicola sp. Rm-C-2C1-2]|uniref:riboflavin synthase subunit alpha n=1 Tax=Salicola sp. Rm-C-2C1-2 TaxID=3141321 RepID=UPI0032E4D149
MFTGIVQGIARVNAIERLAGLHRIRLDCPEGFINNVEIGASVAVNGACLTVTSAWPADHQAAFDVMMETLGVTTLGELQEGDPVNVERAARIGDEIGGHLLSGHVHCMASVSSVEAPENNRRLAFSVPSAWRPYLINKGYIAVDGASLTIAELTDDGFAVYLIPETLRSTRFGSLHEGNRVNIEIDHQTQTIIDTLAHLDLTPRGAD